MPRGAHLGPTTRSPRCGACRSPTSASPGSTTTGRCARACPRRSTRPGKTADAVRRHRRRAARRPGAGPVLLTRADDDQADAALAANPGGRAPRRPTRRVAARAPSGPSGSCVVTAGTADLPVADECAAVARGPRLATRCASPTSAWPACTACSRRRRAGRRRRRRGGRRHGGRAGQRRRRAHRRRRSWPCRPASATAPRSRASPRCWPCWRRAPPGITVVGIDNGFGAACAVARAAPVTSSRPAAVGAERA